MAALFKKKVSYEAEDEITVERLVRQPAAARADELSTRRTKKMPVIDARLLAIARGDVDPEESDPLDPFGGLIPVGDDE